jgi:hypothetical protein
VPNEEVSWRIPQRRSGLGARRFKEAGAEYCTGKIESKRHQHLCQ